MGRINTATRTPAPGRASPAALSAAIQASPCLAPLPGTPFLPSLTPPQDVYFPSLALPPCPPSPDVAPIGVSEPQTQCCAPISPPGFSSRCQGWRCWHELDPSGAPAALPAHAASLVPRHRAARPSGGLSRLSHDLLSLLFFFVLPVVFLPAATTCAAMAIAEGCCAQALQLCLLLWQWLCTCRRLSYRDSAGPRLGTPPALCSACSASLFQGCLGLKAVPGWACVAPRLGGRWLL